MKKVFRDVYRDKQRPAGIERTAKAANRELRKLHNDIRPGGKPIRAPKSRPFNTDVPDTVRKGTL